jgi:succinate dehydrogenase / fumarate reductase cytochrome b subunit
MTTTQPEKTRPRRVWQWGDVRGRHLGMWAYILNRLAGIGLAVYLWLHLVVLAQLARGPAGWDPFIEIVRSPLFLLLDVVLLAGLIIHGLNGLRLTLTGFGFALQQHKALFIGLMAAGALAGVVGVWLIFTK